MNKKEQNTENGESEKIRKSLNYSVKDGAAASAMTGIADSYRGPYAIELGATNQQVGLLTSVSNLVGPLFQLVGLKILKRGVSRKKLVLISVLLHALILIPILLVPFIFKSYRIEILIALFMLYAIFAHFSGPLWASWMGDLVPSQIRGQYFGYRNRVAGIITLGATFGAGYILYKFSNSSEPTERLFVGFVIIFIAAILFRLLSFYYLTRKYEPKFEISHEYEYSFVEFLKRMRNDNFGRFVIYVAAISLAANISGPFFSVYMLRDLEFSYLTFTLVTITASVSSLLSMLFWGKAIDRYGSIYVMRICGFLIPLLPLLWIFAKGNFYVILMIQALGGFSWSGFQLGSFTFVNDVTTQQKRATAFAYFNIINGVGVFIGALLGGFLASYKIPVFTTIFTNTFFTLFLLSGLLRLLFSAVMLPRIHEEKKVESGKPVLQFLGVEPAFGAVRELVVGIYVGSGRIRKLRWQRWFGKELLEDASKGLTKTSEVLERILFYPYKKPRYF
ncbi:MAG: MFS transporter [Nanoarchaeota archaeon]